jgi:PAS domain S-box-containing protein
MPRQTAATGHRAGLAFHVIESPTPMSLTRPPSLRIAVLVTALFWLAAQLGFVFSNYGYLTPVWPPAAVACGAALLFGVRVLGGVALYIAYDFIAYDPTHLARLPLAAVEPLAMLITAALTLRLANAARFDRRLGSVRSVLWLVGLALCYAAVNGVLITLGYCTVGHTWRCEKAGWVQHWIDSMMGDGFGCLICLPAVLSWLPSADERLAGGWRATLHAGAAALRQPRERWLFIGVGVLCAGAAWWMTRHLSVPVQVVGFLALPLLVWAALKFRPFFVHSAILAIGLGTIALQLTARAPAPAELPTHLAALFLFLLSLSALTLLVNVVVQQQNALATQLAFRTQQERVELMLDTASDAVISFDEATRLTYWNPAAERMFGCPAAQALGRPVQRFLPIPGLESAGDDLRRLRDARRELFSGEVLAIETRDAAGEPLPVEVALTAYLNGSAWNATAFVRDARERLRQQEAMRQAKERAEEATRVKSLFLATMSHELRTPLSGVIGMLQLGLRDEMMWATRAKVNLALSNAQSLLAIINDILDYSKIEAGKMVFEQVDFDLRELLQGLTALMDLNAQEKGLSLLCRIDPQVPQWLRSDPVRLRQLLFNLIGNALKFTERGFVEVRVGWQPAQGDERPRLLVEVEDTGVGIPADAQARLFRSFEQADARTTRQHGGTGLGLAISKSLVEGLHGQIAVRSREGEGTCFSFWLPVEPGQPVQAARTTEAGPFDCRLRLLCAEDGPTNQMIVRALVEDMGHAVEFVDNGLDAVRRCAEQRFDAILMDGRMPLMDGVEATQAIRGGGTAQHRVLDPQVWIIALTANATLQDRERSLAAGMNDFLAKPIDERQLAQALHRAVRALREGGHELLPHAPQGMPAGIERPRVFDGAPAARAAIAGAMVPQPVAGGAGAAVLDSAPAPRADNATLKQRLRAAFLVDGSEMLASLRDALQAADWREAARLAHGLKGCALYVGCAPLADAAGWLEAACDQPPPQNPLGQWDVLQNLYDNWAASRD